MVGTSNEAGKIIACQVGHVRVAGSGGWRDQFNPDCRAPTVSRISDGIVALSEVSVGNPGILLGAARPINR